MERLTDDMARLQEDVKSRVSIMSTQLAEFRLNLANDIARDSRERAMFVVENSLSVNRMLKEFHDSRIANGQQDRADRIAFVSNMVKERAELQEELSATRKELLKHTTNEGPVFVADKAITVAALIKEGTRLATGSLEASKQPESAIDTGVVSSEMNTGLLNTWSATAPETAAPVTPKTARPVTPKSAAPVTPKAGALAKPKSAVPVTPKAGALATPKSAAPVTPKAGALATPKSAAPAAPKATAPKSVKSKRNR
jgi:hypothetical protein